MSKLREVFSRFHEVELAYLFSSYAKGRGMPASDVDLAVLVNDRKVIPYLSAEISRVLKLAEDKVSILEMDRAPPMLIVKVLKEGIKLIDRGSTEGKVRRSIPLDVLDVTEESEQAFYRWLYGNSLDRALIARITVHVPEYIDNLKSILEKEKVEVLKKDKDLRKIFERTLHTAIEGMVDLLRCLVSSLNLGVAEYYKDYVEICKNKGVISEKTAGMLLELIPTLHMLIHRYRELNYERLREDARRAIGTWPKLQQEVREYLIKMGKA